MELFLNILWLVIALGALAVWRFRWKRQACRMARKPWQQWTAFAVVLIFVFFAVSLSDDLHAEAILADDCARSRHHSLSWNCGFHSERATADFTLPVGAAILLASPLRAVERLFEPALIDFHVTPDYSTPAFRAPPISLF
jgi:hypothetical protein